MHEQLLDIGPVRLAPGEADTLIGCDLAVAATPEVLGLLAPNAVAVINDHVVMTGDFTTNPDLSFPDAAMKRRIEAHAETSFADLSTLATALLGDAVGANMMALGVAWQKGRVPLTEASILQAIELNGAAVAMNKRAFAWGRALASEPASVLDRLSTPAQQPPATSLADIVDIRAAELNRYHPGYIRVIGSGLALRRFSGVFPINDPMGALDAIQRSLGISSTRLTDRLIFLHS